MRRQLFVHLLMQKLREIISHVIARGVADGFVPHVRSPAAAAVLRSFYKYILPEGMDEVCIAVERGICFVGCYRAGERPGGVGVAVPRHGIIALPVFRTIGRNARKQRIFGDADGIICHLVAGIKAETLIMMVKLVNTSPELVGGILCRRTGIEGGSKAGERAVYRMTTDKRDHAARRDKGVI